MTNYEYMSTFRKCFQILITGATGAGKTSLLQRYDVSKHIMDMKMYLRCTTTIVIVCRTFFNELKHVTRSLKRQLRQFWYSYIYFDKSFFHDCF